jgi:glycosyltransferase involved in cell wall biosynthesis
MFDQLSVVIPTRNEAPRIGRFLTSLPEAVELVVVDASDDTTVEVIQALRPRNTRLIRCGAGIAEARQLGARAARGEWLIFSDADVRFDPAYFGRLRAYLRADGVYGPKYSTGAHPVYDFCFNGGQRVCHAAGVPAASGSNMAVRRGAFEALGGFRLDLPVNEDTDLFLRLARRGFRVAYAPDLAVRSLDDRRLDRGATRKLLHSVSRSALLLLGLYLPLPQRLLRHDWGYWRQRRPPEVPPTGAGGVPETRRS